MGKKITRLIGNHAWTSRDMFFPDTCFESHKKTHMVFRVEIKMCNKIWNIFFPDLGLKCENVTETMFNFFIFWDFIPENKIVWRVFFLLFEPSSGNGNVSVVLFHVLGFNNKFVFVGFSISGPSLENNFVFRSPFSLLAFLKNFFIWFFGKNKFVPLFVHLLGPTYKNGFFFRRVFHILPSWNSVAFFISLLRKKPENAHCPDTMTQENVINAWAPHTITQKCFEIQLNEWWTQNAFWALAGTAQKKNMQKCFGPAKNRRKVQAVRRKIWTFLSQWLTSTPIHPAIDQNPHCAEGTAHDSTHKERRRNVSLRRRWRRKVSALLKPRLGNTLLNFWGFWFGV